MSSSTTQSPSPDPQQRARLLAAALTLGECGDPDDAVRLGVDLLLASYDGPAVVRLASFAPHAAWVDIEPAVHAALNEIGVAAPDERTAAWELARSYAQQLATPGSDAAWWAGALWSLWSRLGEPAEVVDLLEVLDAREETLQQHRGSLDAELRTLAGPVLEAAERALAEGPSE